MTSVQITAADRAERPYTRDELLRRRIPGKRTELCPECGELFAGASVGDKHREGPYTARRCRSRDEMARLGMWTDVRDVWHRGHRPEHAQITPTT